MRCSFVLVTALMLLFASTAQTATQYSGKTVFVKGKVSAQHPQLDSRQLKAQDDIYLRDNVETGDRSFSILKLLDRGKVTVRPLSRFSVLEYSLTAFKAKLKLDKGGVRVESGIIGETSPDQLTIDTPFADIDAQQGKFRMRLCNQDCKTSKSKADMPGREVVARVLERAGQVLAISIDPTNPDATQNRQLAVGAPVYRGDRLITSDQSRLLVVFRDGGRVALGANSELRVEDYRWQEKGKKDTAVFQLVKGGLRALTGKLGKDDPKAYIMETPIAVIGVRGTLYDLLLGESSQLFTFVRQGAVTVGNETGEHLLKEQMGSRMQLAVKEPESIQSIPDNGVIQGTPAPESAQVDLENMLGVEPLDGIPDGLYLFVEDGHIRANGKMGEGKNKVMHLGRYETLFVGQDGRLRRLDKPKDFMSQDELWIPDQNAALCDKTSYWSKKQNRCLCRKGYTYSKKYKKCVSRQTRRCPGTHYYNASKGRCYPKRGSSQGSSQTGRAVRDALIRGAIIWGAGQSGGRSSHHHNP